MKSEKTRLVFRYSFAGFLIFLQIFYTAWSIAVGDWRADYSLPLQLCDVAGIFAAIMLFNKNYLIFETTYFWGLGGSLQALLTPDIGPYSYPHYEFFNFFIGHCAILTAIMFMLVVEKYRPVPKSILRAVVITNIYMAITAIVNIATGGNYMFLCEKPGTSSIMDFLGPWPWYVLSLEVVGLVLMFICYMPFGVADFVRRHRKPRIYANFKGKGIGA